jgi:hypothetical protein
MTHLPLTRRNGLCPALPDRFISQILPTLAICTRNKLSIPGKLLADKLIQHLLRELDRRWSIVNAPDRTFSAKLQQPLIVSARTLPLLPRPHSHTWKGLALVSIPPSRWIHVFWGLFEQAGGTTPRQLISSRCCNMPMVYSIPTALRSS